MDQVNQCCSPNALRQSFTSGMRMMVANCNNKYNIEKTNNVLRWNSKIVLKSFMLAYVNT